MIKHNMKYNNAKDSKRNLLRDRNIPFQCFTCHHQLNTVLQVYNSWRQSALQLHRTVGVGEKIILK
jgi:hypothetical protein